MVRLPAGWVLHPYAGSQQPVMGAAARRIQAIPVTAYQNLITVQIGNEGNAQGNLNGSGAGTLSVGPSGVGNAWYPVSIFVGTGTGIGGILADTSQCVIYAGPLAANQYALQVLIPGTGLVGSLPASLVPGWYVFAVWSGGVPNDTITLNVNGSQDALST